MVGATLREHDPGTDPALIAEIEHDPATRRRAPRPAERRRRHRRWSRAARRRRRRARSAPRARGRPAGTPAAPAAAARAGGGRVKPDAAHVDVVADIGPRAVSRTVLLRLARLPDEAVSVAARGRGARRERRPAGRGRAGRARSSRCGRRDGTLARAEILRPGPPLGFVHPLVREAVYQELSAGQRELMHARAARLLRDAGAPPDQVASHLLSMARRSQEWVVDLLVEAAESARATSRARQRRGLPHPRVGGAAEPRPAWADPARSRHLRHEHLRPAGAGAPGRGLRATRGSPQAGNRGVAPSRTLIFAGSPEAAAAFAQRAPPNFHRSCRTSATRWRPWS